MTQSTHPLVPSPLSRRDALAWAGLTGLTGLTATAGLALGQTARGAQPAASAAGQSPPLTSATGQPPGFYRFKIGSLEAVALSDGQGTISPIQPVLAPEATPEELGRVLAQHHHAPDAAAIYFGVLAVRIGPELVLFDAGNAPTEDASAPAGRLPHAMHAAGLKPEQVTAVVFSHGHGDHISGALNREDRPVFPNARYFMNKAEHDYWTGPAAELPGTRMPAEWKKNALARARKILGILAPKLELVRPGDKILGAIELLDAPGHTPGHMPAVISDGDQRLVAMADLAHNHVLMFARPDWTVAFDTDAVMAAQARRTLFDRFASERARVFAYHLPWPGLGFVDRQAEGYRWSPEPWFW